MALSKEEAIKLLEPYVSGPSPILAKLKQRKEYMNKFYIKAPNPIPDNCPTTKIFLAGTIDNGNSFDWQSMIANDIYKHFGDTAVIFNPRRENWDPEMKPFLSNKVFDEQVQWELDRLDESTSIIFNFLYGSISPITLLELGLYASSGKCHVICPEDFWRSGNVHKICQIYNIPLYNDVVDFCIDGLKLLR